MKSQAIYHSWAIAALLFLIVSIMGCKNNDNNPPDETNTFSNLIVNADFKFSSLNTILAHFTVIPAFPEEFQHVIKIYDGNPAAGGKLITKGYTNTNYKYNVSFKLPERLNSVYVENSNADGIFQLEEVEIAGNTINHTFYSGQFYWGYLNKIKCDVVDPGCGGDCDETLSGTYTDLLLDKDDYCVAEGTTLTVTGQLKFKRKASLVVCGTLQVNQMASIDNKAGELWVSGSGILSTTGNLNINSKLHFYNFGDFTVNGNLTTKKNYKFFNYGAMTITGDVNNLTNNFKNKETLTIQGNFNNNSTGKAYNYGTLLISQNMNINNNSKLFNYCNLRITGNLTIAKEAKNYSYIQVDNTLSVNTNKKLFLYNGALISTQNLTLNGKMKACGTGYSKINISNNTILNSTSRAENKMDICDQNGIEVNEGFISNQTVYCEVTIPQSACNPGSSSGGGPTDTDGDGVADAYDDYPDDAERAFDNYYPNQQDYGTFAFEDLWPGMGDYDFNDLVLDFNYQIVTNASNLIVDIIIKSHVKAAGASLNNGFGLSIPVNPANCGSVSGYVHAFNNLNLNAKGYENGHTSHTVVIFYDAINTIYNSSMFNTDPDGNVVVTDTITVTTYFSNPQIALGHEPYNPFLYVNQERGKEIHLIDNPPTDLVNDTYFDTYHDDSNPATGRYYVTNTNLPWVIQIPVSFDYPVEKADILTAYLKFETWAATSGSTYTDWYLDEPGYRNDDNIYGTE